jgi:hypothetical protein
MKISRALRVDGARRLSGRCELKFGQGSPAQCGGWVCHHKTLTFEQAKAYAELAGERVVRPARNIRVDWPAGRALGGAPTIEKRTADVRSPLT